MKERLRLWCIQALGGYPDAETAITSVTDVKEKRRLLTLAVKRLFNTIGPEDILRANEKNQWIIEGKIVPVGELKHLIAEADKFLGSDLWRVLQLDIKYQANRAMFIKGQSEEDLTAGKLSLYNLDIVNTRLKSLSKGSPLLNSDPKGK